MQRTQAENPDRESMRGNTDREPRQGTQIVNLGGKTQVGAIEKIARDCMVDQIEMN